MSYTTDYPNTKSFLIYLTLVYTSIATLMSIVFIFDAVMRKIWT